ncbi:hypothetical protein PIB30_073457 [Stylosanthes scabra]|uniref:Uncharacterized protein n=1 Tax=Stylosanthes scabra TaxID=79078 RepID=A0ABU6QRL1_9FABA|nr:hypothetical protein [Stylosanthes scabra]
MESTGRGKVKPECRVGLPRVVLLAYLLEFWRFIRTENPWVGDSHSVYFRLFRYRFELGKLAKLPPGVFGLASPEIESSVVFCRRISEVCPEYVIGFRAFSNGPGLRRFEVKRFSEGKTCFGRTSVSVTLVLNVEIGLHEKQFCRNAAEPQRIDSLSYFPKKNGFREQRVDSHDLRIDSECHRGLLTIT